MSFELKQLHDETSSTPVTITLDLRLIAEVDRVDMLKRKHPAKLYYNPAGNGQILLVPEREGRKGNWILAFENYEQLKQQEPGLAELVKKHDARVRATTPYADDSKCIIKNSEGQA